MGHLPDKGHRATTHHERDADKRNDFREEELKARAARRGEQRAVAPHVLCNSMQQGGQLTICNNYVPCATTPACDHTIWNTASDVTDVTYATTVRRANSRYEGDELTWRRSARRNMIEGKR